MSKAKTRRGAAKTTIITPGAFDFWPNSASRITGLGGQAIDPNPAYAFHTKYVELGAGLVTCTLRFTRMEASIGTLSISVNGLPPTPGARAELIRNWTAQLDEIAEGEGVVEVSFQASAGSRYAVLGHIFGDTDARAQSLAISLEVTPDSANFRENQAAIRKSIFGRRMFRRANRMIVNTAPTLADPTSQGCTAAQFDEPAYARWTKEMRIEPQRHRETWDHVYILQTLYRYGMLRPGARGIGFGVGTERLPAVMASHGCSILASDLPLSDPQSLEWARIGEHAASVESLRYPRICADDVFDRQVSFRAVNMNAIDRDLNGFDFAWSSRAMEHLGSIEAGHALVLDSIACLTYGGLAVHTTTFNLGSNGDTIDEGATVLFRKQDMERIAVDLVSRGHFVAQFKYDFGATPVDTQPEGSPSSADDPLTTRFGEYAATSFGIMVRRGDR